MITYTTATTRGELQQILDLQQRNVPSAISAAEAREQGFVTARHDLALLQALCGRHGHIIAKQDDRVAGYALVMLREFKDTVAVLAPLFDAVDRRLGRDYFVMGQICIDKPFRGQGVFGGLYGHLKKLMSGVFSCVVTEVSTRNERSLRAHQKVGFQKLQRYRLADEEWEIISWDWRTGC